MAMVEKGSIKDISFEVLPYVDGDSIRIPDSLIAVAEKFNLELVDLINIILWNYAYIERGEERELLKKILANNKFSDDEKKKFLGVIFETMKGEMKNGK